jgi:hypothetical protein
VLAFEYVLSKIRSSKRRSILTHYQIAIVTNQAAAEETLLKKTLERHFAELGIDPQFLTFLDENTIASRDPKAPTVAAYLSVNTHPKSSAGIASLLSQGILVVPVVPDIRQYNEFVFPDLFHVNGLEMSTPDDPNLEKVAAVLLEGLNLLRKTRRLFISYRRSETQSIAIQLFELLEECGFDVFLDTHSVRPGEPFQDVLWHRLADTDVVVLLDSPDFLESRWTVEELARSNTTNVQILQLVWPGTSIKAIAAFSRVWQLTNYDFEGSSTLGQGTRLTDRTKKLIATEVESLRARAIAARYTYLVGELCAEAAALNLSPKIQPQRYITLQRKPGSFSAAVPAVGVPDATNYHQIEEEFDGHKPAYAEVILFYDERGVRDRWLGHLAWLDRQNLAVRSIQVAGIAAWLRS